MKLFELFVDIVGRTNGLDDSISEAGGKVDKFASQMDKKAVKNATMLGNLQAMVIQKATRFAMDSVKNALNVGKDFTAEMSKVYAIAGASAEDQIRLSDKAKELGASTMFTATQTGQAFEYMAMAGWSSQQMLDGISGTLDLAAASGADLGRVSDILTDSITAFGDSAGDAGRYADVMTQTSISSNTTVEMLGEAYKNCAALAGTLGFSVEDVSTSLGVMANSGIKGAEAGTSLKRVFSNLAAPTKSMTKLMNKYGIATKDAQGEMRSWDDILGQMRTAAKVMSQDELANFAKEIGGQTGMAGLLTLLNADQKEYDQLYKNIQDADKNDVAQTVAEQMQNNLQGDITKLQSAMDGLYLKIFDGVEPFLRDGTQMLTTIVSSITAGDFDGVVTALSDAAGKISDAIKLKIEGIPSVLNSVFDLGLKGPQIRNMAKAVGDWYTQLTTAIGQKDWSTAWDKIKDGAQGAFDFISKTVLPSAITDIGNTMIDLVNNVFGTSFEHMDEGTVSNITDGITSMFSDVGKNITDFIDTLAKSDIDLSGFGELFGAIASAAGVVGGLAGDAFKGINDFIAKLTGGDSAGTAFAGAIVSLINSMSSFTGSVATDFTTAFGKVQDFFKNDTVQDILGQWSSALETIITFPSKVAENWGTIKEIITETFSEIKEIWDNSEFGKWVNDMIAKFQPIIDMFNQSANQSAAATIAGNVANGLSDDIWNVDNYEGINNALTGFSNLIKGDVLQGINMALTEHASSWDENGNPILSQEDVTKAKGMLNDALSDPDASQIGVAITDVLSQQYTVEPDADTKTLIANIMSALQGANFTIDVQANVHGLPKGEKNVHEPGLAGGIDFVPYNEFEANLHRGEMVLTRPEANAYKNGNSGNIDYAMMARVITNAMGAVNINMDGRVVGSLVAPTVNEALARAMG